MYSLVWYDIEWFILVWFGSELQARDAAPFLDLS